MNKRALDRAVAKVLGYTNDGSAWWTHPDGLRTSVDGLPRLMRRSLRLRLRSLMSCGGEGCGGRLIVE
jgi:hypothetical protein